MLPPPERKSACFCSFLSCLYAHIFIIIYVSIISLYIYIFIYVYIDIYIYRYRYIVNVQVYQWPCVTQDAFMFLPAGTHPHHVYCSLYWLWTARVVAGKGYKNLSHLWTPLLWPGVIGMHVDDGLSNCRGWRDDIFMDPRNQTRLLSQASTRLNCQIKALYFHR